MHASYPFYDYSRELWSLKYRVSRGDRIFVGSGRPAKDFPSAEKFSFAFEIFEKKKKKEEWREKLRNELIIRTNLFVVL